MHFRLWTNYKSYSYNAMVDGEQLFGYDGV